MGLNTSKNRLHDWLQKRATYLRQIEKFVLEVYFNCSGMETMRLMLSSEMSSAFFAKYVRFMEADENVEMYFYIARIKATLMSKHEMIEHIKTLYDTYMNCNLQTKLVKISEELVEQYVGLLQSSEEAKEDDFIKKLRAVFSSSIDELVYLMARDQLSQYIHSKYYKRWRAAEASHAMAYTPDYLHEISHSHDPDDIDKHSVHFEHASVLQTPALRQQLSLSAFKSVKSENVSHILNLSPWLPVLLSATEALPICFAMVDCHNEKHPFIYCNRYISKALGYPRRFLLGKSIKCIECPETDPQCSKNFQNACTTGKSIEFKAIYSANFGTKFPAAVALKSVSNNEGVLAYMIVILLDISKEEDEGASKKKLARELLAMIPKKLLTDKDSADEWQAAPEHYSVTTRTVLSEARINPR